MGLGTGCQLLPKIDVVAWHPRPATRPYLQPVTVQIGFLRAVNVGRRRVAMGRLVEVVEGLGYGAVWTYINSGNVVFEASGPRADLEQAMGVALESAFGFEVTTFVRTEAELRRAIAAEPFEVIDSIGPLNVSAAVLGPIWVTMSVRALVVSFGSATRPRIETSAINAGNSESSP